jgi:HK97 family phage portal protein
MRFKERLSMMGDLLSGKQFEIIRPEANEDNVPSTRINLGRAVGSGLNNSIAVACVRWVQRTFPQAPLMLQGVNADGQFEQIDQHLLLDLLDMPNPFYGLDDLWKATIAEYDLKGNAYWWKVRSESGIVQELWWLPTSLVTPKWPAHDDTVFISHYEYRPNTRPIPIPVEDIVHFRDGLDPDNQRLGLSPFAALVREIFTDNMGANYTSSLLRNLGVPGLIVSPEDMDTEPSPEDVKATKLFFQRMFSGDNIGQPLVMSSPTKVQAFGYNPQQMSAKDARRIPEERVTAVLGVPAIVAGLGAGLDRSTFANMQEAREMGYENNIIPKYQAFANTLMKQLLPEFTMTGQRLRLAFDTSGVRILQEDEDKLHTRIRENVKVGLLTVNEARVILGEDRVEDDPGADVLAVTGAARQSLTPSAGGLNFFNASSHELMGAKALEGVYKVIPDDAGIIPQTVEDAARLIERGWRKRFSQELARVLEVFGAKIDYDPSVFDNLDWDWWGRYEQEVTDELIKAFNAAASASGAGTLVTLQEAAAEFARARAAELLRLDGDANVVRFTRERVRKLVADNVAGDGNLSALVKSLREDVAFSKTRATTVARTETAISLGQGKRAVALEDGSNEKHWVTQGDENVDEICQENEARGWISANDAFPSGHDTIPAHPDCNCTVVYRTADQGRSLSCPGCGKRTPVNFVPKGQRVLVYCKKCNTERWMH